MAGGLLITAAMTACAVPPARPAKPGPITAPAASSSHLTVIVVPTLGPVLPIDRSRTPQSLPLGGVVGGAQVRHRFARNATFGVAIAGLEHFGSLEHCAVTTASCQILSLVRGDQVGRAVPAPHAWSDLSAGKTHIYGLRTDEETFDRITETGHIERFAGGAQGAMDSGRVIELADRVVALTIDERGLHTSEVVSEDGVRVLKPREHLAYRTVLPRVPGGAVSAQRVRQLKERELVAVWGPVDHAVLLDAAGLPTDDWVLMLVQVDAPPPAWPKGKPFRTHAGAKQSCGAIGTSRALADRSVPKTVRMLRFRGAALLRDEVAWRTNELDQEGSPVTVRALPGLRVELSGVPLDEKDHLPPRAQPQLTKRAVAPVVPGTENYVHTVDPAIESLT